MRVGNFYKGEKCMAKSKSKRNPKSKPKSKGNFMGYEAVDTTSPEAKKRKRIRDNIFYSVVLLLFAALFIGVPAATIWGNSQEDSVPATETTTISGTSDSESTGDASDVQTEEEQIEVDSAVGEIETGNASVHTGESVIKKQTETGQE